MSKPHQKGLKELQRDWDEKLRASKFVDIESRRFRGRSVLYDLSRRKNFSSFDSYQSTLEYYARARAVLVHYHFNDSGLREIWALYSEGLSYTEIADTLGSSKQRIYLKVKRIMAFPKVKRLMTSRIRRSSS